MEGQRRSNRASRIEKRKKMAMECESKPKPKNQLNNIPSPPLPPTLNIDNQKVESEIDINKPRRIQ